MNRRNLLLGLATGLLIATTSLAQNFPSYYPEDGFQRTGTIDAVYADENRVVIDDVPYQVSENLVVHSMSSANVSKARIRAGIKVGFKQGNNRVITEFWLLPLNYDARR